MPNKFLIYIPVQQFPNFLECLKNIDISCEPTKFWSRNQSRIFTNIGTILLRFNSDLVLIERLNDTLSCQGRHQTLLDASFDQQAVVESGAVSQCRGSQKYRSHGWWRGGVCPPLADPPLRVTQGETGMIKQMTPSHPCRRKHEPWLATNLQHISCGQAAQQALIATGSAHSNICIAARCLLYFYWRNISFPSILEINQGRFFFANVSDHKHRRLLPSLFYLLLNWYLAENLS